MDTVIFYSVIALFAWMCLSNFLSMFKGGKEWSLKSILKSFDKDMAKQTKYNELRKRGVSHERITETLKNDNK